MTHDSVGNKLPPPAMVAFDASAKQLTDAGVRDSFLLAISSALAAGSFVEYDAKARVARITNKDGLRTKVLDCAPVGQK